MLYRHKSERQMVQFAKSLGMTVDRRGKHLHLRYGDKLVVIPAKIDGHGSLRKSIRSRLLKTKQ